MSKKTALVFGGSRGIGAACVQALARNILQEAARRMADSGCDKALAGEWLIRHRHRHARHSERPCEIAAGR